MNYWRRILVQGVALILCTWYVMGQQTNLLPNGSFESGKPSLWTAEPGTSAGVSLVWDTVAQTLPRSLKIVKPNTGDTARWISKNNVRYWVDNIASGVDIKLGAWVKTSGVNTSPATAAAKWQLKFWFYDTLGALIGGQPFVLDVDQTVATKDWYADTNGVGTVNLPSKAYKLIVTAEGGPDATGTVWFDTFIFVGRGDWAGQNWNGFVDADSGWQYWIAPNGGNDGQTYFPGSGVSTAYARTGNYSLKVTAPSGRSSGELVWFSETVPIPAGSAGKEYVLSAWVKTTDIVADSVFNASSALGFTWTWHTQPFTDGGGWNEYGSGEWRFVLNNSSQDWTQYQVILTVPDNTVNAISVRPRTWPLWYGTAYYDDFALNAVKSAVTSVERDELVDKTIPTSFDVKQNFPNPFNPSTTIRYAIPVMSPVKVEVFNIVGQKIATLVDKIQPAGTWQVEWTGKDDLNRIVATGVYLYRVSTPGFTMTRKMVFVK